MKAINEKKRRRVRTTLPITSFFKPSKANSDTEEMTSGIRSQAGERSSIQLTGCIKREGMNKSRFQECPICKRHFPLHQILSHSSICGLGGHSLISEPIKTYTKNNVRSLQDIPFKEPLPGLFIFEEFISIEEELHILEAIKDNSDGPKWKSCSFNGRHLGKRWGVHCNLQEKKVTCAEHDLPSFFHKIIFPKLLGLKPMKGIVPNESNAIEYRKSMNHYLVSHVDNRHLSKEPIANLSLAGSCLMKFTNVKNDVGFVQSEMKILLKARTLQIMTGKARYSYSHGIDKGDITDDRRVSLTMRESPLTRSGNVI